MHLEEIRLGGFRSFRQPQVLDLRNLPAGLYLVTGENKEQPALGANGIGKSTLFDAVMWVLQGETSRGLRATNIRSWGGKGGAVASLVVDGVQVERSWKPNHIKVDGEELTQAQLDEVTKLTPEVLQNTFYFSQFGQFFLDLKPSQRMPIYASVLQLELWERKSDSAKRLARLAQADVQEAEQEAAAAKAKVEALQQEQVGYEEATASWTKERRQSCRQLRQRIKEAEEAAAEVEAERRSLQKQSRDLEKKLAASEKQVREAGNVLRKATTALAEARAAASSAAKRLRELREALKEAQSADVCPTCGQAINKTNAKKHVGHLRQQVAQAEEAEKSARADVMDAAETLEEAEDAENRAASLAGAHERAIQELTRQLDRKERPVADEVKRLTEELAQLERSESPYDRLQDRVLRKIDRAKTSLAQINGQLTAAREAQALFEFWVKGFKDIRFQVMQESLVQLNAEVNECLHDLGLEGWRLEFQVERETKSGSLSRGFQCLVSSPKSPDAVPWEAWSGGETQRLRIVAQMGVSNMIASRLGLSLDVEMWDEPSNWLNEGGIKAALELLKERAERYGRRIFIADHRSLDFDFDGVLRIVKSKTKGSLLLPSWVP